MPETAFDNDLQEFFAANRTPRRGCHVGTVIRDLLEKDPERAEKLMHAIATPEIQHSAICRVLESWDYQVRQDTMAYHRRSCSCTPDLRHVTDRRR